MSMMPKPGHTLEGRLGELSTLGLTWDRDATKAKSAQDFLRSVEIQKPLLAGYTFDNDPDGPGPMHRNRRVLVRGDLPDQITPKPLNRSCITFLYWTPDQTYKIMLFVTEKAIRFHVSAGFTAFQGGDMCCRMADLLKPGLPREPSITIVNETLHMGHEIVLEDFYQIMQDRLPGVRIQLKTGAKQPKVEIRWCEPARDDRSLSGICTHDPHCTQHRSRARRVCRITSITIYSTGTVCVKAARDLPHANMLVEDRLKVGITDGFVRISCGLEDPDDLIRSLKASLDAL